VFEFDHVVTKDTGNIRCCTSSVCKDLVAQNLFVLGKKVIARPPSDFFENGKGYNVSIFSTTFKYFEGLSADLDRVWYYSFTVEPATGVDTGKPVLVTSHLDCTADDNLGTTSGISDSCDIDLDGATDFTEIDDELPVSPPSAVPTGAKFKLYFREKVKFTKTTLTALSADDTSAVGNLLPAVGSDPYDCVVTMSPALSTGKLYTLSLMPGAITDASPLENPYEGTSFTFFYTFGLAKHIPGKWGYDTAQK
jgi:hypothetical protein